MTAIAAIENIDRVRLHVEGLASATLGLIERAAVSYFAVKRTDLRRQTSWPQPEAQARATVIYILHTNLHYTLNEAGLHFCMSPRVAGRAVRRITDLRDDDAGFEFWITELSDAMRSI